MRSINLNRLPRPALAIILWVFDHVIVDNHPCTVVEVRLDNPIEHLLFGGDGLNLISSFRAGEAIDHNCDDNWAVIYKNCPDWIRMDLHREGEEIVEMASRCNSDKELEDIISVIKAPKTWVM